MPHMKQHSCTLSTLVKNRSICLLLNQLGRTDFEHQQLNLGIFFFIQALRQNSSYRGSKKVFFCCNKLYRKVTFIFQYSSCSFGTDCHQRMQNETSKNMMQLSHSVSHTLHYSPLAQLISLLEGITPTQHDTSLLFSPAALDSWLSLYFIFSFSRVLAAKELLTN